MVLSKTFDLLLVQGGLAIAFCALLFVLSSDTLGTRSLSHWWLFNNLLVLHPTEESVAYITGVGSQPRRHQLPQTLEARISALELTASQIQPGMMARGALRSKEKYALWRCLDASVIFAITCLFGLAMRFLVSLYQVFIVQKGLCCSDLVCWAEWCAQMLNSTTVLSLIIMSSMASFWFLATLSSQMVTASNVRYPPSCYLTGFLLGIFSLWLCYTPALLRFWDLPIQSALEELSIRCLVWLRLVFASFNDRGLEEEEWLKFFEGVFKLTVALLCALVGFALSEPVSVSVQTVIYAWQNLGSDVISNPHKVYQPNESHGTLREITQCSCKLYIRVALAGSFLLPLSVIWTYVTGGGLVKIRALLGWAFVGLMAAMCHTLLQCYLQKSLVDVAVVLSQSRCPESDHISNPFRRRMDCLIRVGGQLIVFPLTVMAILTTGHNCLHATTHPPLYPVMSVTMDSYAAEGAWLRNLAFDFYKERFESQIFLPSFFISCDESRISQHDDAVIRSPEALIQSAPYVSISFYQALRKMQQMAKRAKTEPAVRYALFNTDWEAKTALDTDSVKETREAVEEFVKVTTAILRHPLVTSTVVFPMADYFGFILSVLWTLTFVASLRRGVSRSHDALPERLLKIRRE